MQWKCVGGRPCLVLCTGTVLAEALLRTTGRKSAGLAGFYRYHPPGWTFHGEKIIEKSLFPHDALIGVKNKVRPHLVAQNSLLRNKNPVRACFSQRCTKCFCQSPGHCRPAKTHNADHLAADFQYIGQVCFLSRQQRLPSPCSAVPCDSPNSCGGMCVIFTILSTADI